MRLLIVSDEDGLMLALEGGNMRNSQKVLAALTAVMTLTGLAACGNANASNGNAGDADKAELVFWGWDTGHTMSDLIKDFQKANLGITVKFNNTGTASDTQTALSNAIAAGKGAPDVVMLEDPTVTQFAVTGDLADLSQFGVDKLADDFSAGPWNKLQYGGKPYALPIDSGPEMFFYNDAVFKKAGVDGTQIKTWDDYYEAAKKVRAIGSYMTNNSGSSMEYQPFTAQAWQAGAANWSDDWNRELNDGTIASLTIGGWMPINLMNGAPDQAGNWRVAQLPQWEEGEEASAEDGGSALAVVSQSKQQAAAYKFVEYLTHGEGAKTMADTGTFPSLKSILTSEDFTDPTTEANKKVNDYFGGQNVNEVLSEAAQRKVSEFSYLPYNPFAQSSFGDQISKAYNKEITLKEAFANYGKALAEHGTQQGYTVTNKG